MNSRRLTLANFSNAALLRITTPDVKANLMVLENPNGTTKAKALLFVRSRQEANTVRAETRLNCPPANRTTATSAKTKVAAGQYLARRATLFSFAEGCELARVTSSCS